MTIPLRQPWTQDRFFAWAETQERRYEFDGFQPVAMNGGSWNHDRISRNIHLALRPRLRGTPCQTAGPNAGVATIGDIVRYPDALVTCSKGPGESRLIPGVVIVFEVLSPGSGGIDRIVKLREYLAVPSIKRYVILESALIGLTVLVKQSDGAWSASSLTAEDTLRLPEIGIEVPVTELYEDVEFMDTP